MIKLILSDMDGTLLDDDGQVPEGFDAVIGQLRERGVIFAPCSGRQYFQSADVVFFKDTGIVIGVSIHSSFFLRKNTASRTRNEERRSKNG